MNYNFSRPIQYCPHCGGSISYREVEGRKRPHCAACRATFYEDPKLAVAVLIRDGEGLVLQQRNIDPGRGYWTFPSGYVERGERVEDAAVREAAEETGLDVAITGLLGLYSHIGNPVVLAVYTADPIGGVLSASAESHAVATFPLDDLPALAFEHDPEIVAAWVRRQQVSRPVPAESQ